MERNVSRTYVIGEGSATPREIEKNLAIFKANAFLRFQKGTKGTSKIMTSDDVG